MQKRIGFMDKRLKEIINEINAGLKRNKHIQIGALVLAAILIGMLGYCSGKRSGSGSYQQLSANDAFDSLVAVLPKGSVVVARFPDEKRSDLYYMNSGVMYCFDGLTKFLEQIVISGAEDGSIISAKLSQDEKYITLTVRQGQLDKLYRLNTITKNIVDLDKSSVVEEDVKNVEEKAPKPAETKPEVPKITEPLPEAVFADEPAGGSHEERRESQEQKTESAPAPEVTPISTD